MLARMHGRWGNPKSLVGRKISTTAMKIRIYLHKKLTSEELFDPAILLLDIVPKVSTRHTLEISIYPFLLNPIYNS